ncbi:MAG: hypothetical protein GVY28_03245 [Alphaproteobacteria bacterium]|jgi:Flp pilus assembly protein TadG|nr:hypothetical protein [Alphaproteobacteria bacterium]
MAGILKIHRWVGAVRRLIAHRRGSMAVEAALVVPVMATLLIGGVDFGTAYVEGVRLSGAARAGTQPALYDPQSWQNGTAMELTALSEYTGTAVSGDTRVALPVSAAARSFCACQGDAELQCTSTCADGSTPGRFVAVTVSRDHGLIMDWPFVRGKTVTIARQSVVRVR